MKLFKKEDVVKDLQNFKLKGHYEKIKNVYKKIPITKCNCCGKCCYDSPVCSYAEFLPVYDRFLEFDKDLQIKLLKKSIIHSLYGVSIELKPCIFLNENNQCIIHDISPLSCKLWGLQGEEYFKKTLESDNERNKLYQDLCASKGINITDEFLKAVQLSYCNKVEIVKDPYKITTRDHKLLEKDIFNITIKYHGKNNPWSVITYLAYIYMGSKLADDKTSVILEYQNGNLNAIDDYINKINFEELL